MNNRQSLLAAVALVAFTTASQASTLITFDDIPGASNYNGHIPADYKGLSWTNLDYINPFNSGSDVANSGAGTGIVSLSYDAVSTSGVPVQIQSAAPFMLNSAYFAANWNDGLQVTVRGEFEGAITHTKTFTVNTAGSTREFFNWQNIDTVLITATGGTFHTHNNGTSFAMDNLIISNVPEPESYAMLLAGLGLVGFIARRRKISST